VAAVRRAGQQPRARPSLPAPPPAQPRACACALPDQACLKSAIQAAVIRLLTSCARLRARARRRNVVGAADAPAAGAGLQRELSAPWVRGGKWTGSPEDFEEAWLAEVARR